MEFNELIRLNEQYFTNNGDVNVRATINEHRAPTDESVKLLNEMQEKAKENIIDSISVSDNVLNYKAILYCDHKNLTGMDKYSYQIKFTLNDKEFKYNGEINGIEIYRDNEIREAIKIFRNEAKGMIAAHIVKELSKIIIDELIKL